MENVQLKRLEDERIFSVFSEGDGLNFTEGCDNHFSHDLSRDDVIHLAHELLAMVSAQPEAKDAWIKITSPHDLPLKTQAAYQQIECLILHKDNVLLRVWNCEHEVWDDENGDDFFCEATDPSHYMVITRPSPSNETEKQS